MNIELEFLFKFQLVIIEMQYKIIDLKIKGAKKDVLKPSEDRIDNLIEIYKNFDKYYYAAHFARQKNINLEQQLLSLASQIEGLKTENIKLLESLNWNPEC